MRVMINLGILFIVFAFSAAGCASLKEDAKGFLGTSTKQLEESRGDAVIKLVHGDYISVYTKSQDALKKMGAYIFSQDIGKGMIAVYVAENDTTPAGFFFVTQGNDATRIEVTSPSIIAKTEMADKLFNALTNTTGTNTAGLK